MGDLTAFQLRENAAHAFVEQRAADLRVGLGRRDAPPEEDAPADGWPMLLFLVDTVRDIVK